LAPRWSVAVCCLLFTGCSESLSGEWSVDSMVLSSGQGSALQGIDGNLLVNNDGTAELNVVLGDTAGEYLEIGADGTATSTGDSAFNFVAADGFQEEPGNAIFIDLDLDCTTTETSAECSGAWTSRGLEDQTITLSLTTL